MFVFERSTAIVVGDGGDESSTSDAHAGGDVVQPPQGCDVKAQPKDSPKCVDDSYGVFVDADGYAGTRTLP